MDVPSAAHLAAVKPIRERMPLWRRTDDALAWLAAEHEHDAPGILGEIALVNTLYSTFLTTEDVLDVAARVAQEDRLGRLVKGDRTAVDEIARGERNFRSFASKFSHFHRPEAFPIFDSYVERALKALGAPPVGDTYETFFQSVSGLRNAMRPQPSWKELDEYLWLLGAWKAPLRNGRREVNRELRDLMESPGGEDLFQGLDPTGDGPNG